MKKAQPMSEARPMTEPLTLALETSSPAPHPSSTRHPKHHPCDSLRPPAFLLALIAAASFVTAPAQAGSLRITVTDKDGNPVPDVVVQLRPAAKPAASSPTPPPAPTLTIVINQEGSRFVPFLTIVPVGSTLRFVNKDGYDHHVRSTSSGPLGSMAPVKNFEMRLDANPSPSSDASQAATAPVRSKLAGPPPGNFSAEIQVDQVGAIGLGCYLHSSMRGQLYVTDTPWFAKTDASGVAAIDSVPDGAASLTVWHPDQLQDQTAVPVQISATPLKTSTQLNFTPRRRRI